MFITFLYSDNPLSRNDSSQSDTFD